jgi:hypothetical protein
VLARVARHGTNHASLGLQVKPMLGLLSNNREDNMKTIINDINTWELVKLFGGLSLIISAIVSFLALIIRDYFLNRNEKQKEKEIETLKQQYSKTEAMFGYITDNISKSYSSSNERILKAYEEIWNTMLKIRNQMPVFAYKVYTIFTMDELETLPKNKKYQSDLNRIDYNDYFLKIAQITENVETCRPFVRDRAWSVFFVYRATYGRLVYLLDEGRAKDKIRLWYDDASFIDQVLGMVIEKDNISKLIENRVIAFHNVVSYLELLMQEEVQNFIYGRNISNEILGKAIEYGSIIENINSTTK